MCVRFFFYFIFFLYLCWQYARRPHLLRRHSRSIDLTRVLIRICWIRSRDVKGDFSVEDTAIIHKRHMGVFFIYFVGMVLVFNIFIRICINLNLPVLMELTLHILLINRSVVAMGTFFSYSLPFIYKRHLSLQNTLYWNVRIRTRDYIFKFIHRRKQKLVFTPAVDLHVIRKEYITEWNVVLCV